MDDFLCFSLDIRLCYVSTGIMQVPKSQPGTQTRERLMNMADDVNQAPSAADLGREWLDTPLGQALLGQEIRLVEEALDGIAAAGEGEGIDPSATSSSCAARSAWPASRVSTPVHTRTSGSSAASPRGRPAEGPAGRT